MSTEARLAIPEPCAWCHGVGHQSPATTENVLDYGRACGPCDGTGIDYAITDEPAFSQADLDAAVKAERERCTDACLKAAVWVEMDMPAPKGALGRSVRNGAHGGIRHALGGICAAIEHPEDQ